MTPLFLAFLQIETADIVFAIDSIPAIFAITLDPFIVYTSNIFSIFGLRALYFSLAPLIRRFRFIKTSLSIILVYIGIKMLIVDYYRIPNIFSLIIIIGLIGSGIALSVIFPKKAKLSVKFPLETEFTQLYFFTLRQVKKIVVLILGASTLLIGVILIFLPGPAFLFIFLGVLVLSTEFILAKKFLKKIKSLTGGKPSKDEDSPG